MAVCVIYTNFARQPLKTIKETKDKESAFIMIFCNTQGKSKAGKHCALLFIKQTLSSKRSRLI